MPRLIDLPSILIMSSFITLTLTAPCESPLPGTTPLEMSGDLAEQMVTGIHHDLDARTAAARVERQDRWTAQGTDAEFLAEQRATLAQLLGVVDDRLPIAMETVAPPGLEGPVAAGEGYTIYRVRWPVFDGVWGEGLLVEPDGETRASMVLLSDADQAPRSLFFDSPLNTAYAAQLAQPQTRILVPVLVSRSDTWSGHPKVRMTNQPHREWIYRAAFEMGRHVIGYEVQKVQAAIDWLEQQAPEAPIGVTGYGEGGLLALHTAALDTRIQATLVSGYFGPREGLWEEPIYRNVWSLLKDFGDGELAAMIAPRTLIVEPAAPPHVTGPPLTEGRPHGAAPGVVPTPSLEAIQGEIDRATGYRANSAEQPWLVLAGDTAKPAGQLASLRPFMAALGIALTDTPTPKTTLEDFPVYDDTRMKRQVDGLLAWTDHVVAEAPFTRKALWEKADATSVETWEQSTTWYRNHFHESVIGKIQPPTRPFNARSRQVYETDAFIGYDVVLDVYDDVFAYGQLLVPKGIPAGEQRPVVVCQHGLEGRPQDVADPENVHQAYEQYGCRLAEQGFIVYAPQNPYIGGDHFRTLQRKANPLGLSLFSYIIEQHRQTLDWLKTQPFVDPERIAFYGLSYGGKTAMRVPAILEDYCLSICSGDYNEWIWKNVTRRQIYSYVFHGEYEMFEWNMGNTYNYAEMSWLICPRPFMVERGHFDGVAPDDWVGYEFARTQRRYDLLEIGDAATIEHFNGPHKINGVGTFAFLQEKLNFPPVE